MAHPDIRVRFAPSPTGYLHVGGVRTALFNWLYARKVGGAFLLRIEDTDTKRSSPEHTDVILDGLRWIGLDWDEDVVFQGAGLDRHRQFAEQLRASERTYEDDGALRFRMPEEEILWDDVVHGAIRFDGSHIKDWVILRSDGTPTYNFVVVADDIHMRISHVLRGDDHISNTPKQIAVYRALGIAPPLFGHVPNVHGDDGKKLSKRHGATAIGDYREAGFLPSAMRNFLSLLGWNPGDDRELFFSEEELIQAFSLENIQGKSAIFDVKKLGWMNGQHMIHMPVAELAPLVRPVLVANYSIGEELDDTRLHRLIDVVKHRSRVTADIARQVALRVDRSRIEWTEKAKKFIEKDEDGYRRALEKTIPRLETMSGDEWAPEPLERVLRELAEQLGAGLGKIMQPIRIALTGDTVSEPVNELLWVIGKEEAVARLRATLAP
jgi:glutamyl-tRNA synthetase